MGPFSKEKKLVDYDLKELDLEMLSNSKLVWLRS